LVKKDFSHFPDHGNEKTLDNTAVWDRVGRRFICY
jgi:hypothetical protein